MKYASIILLISIIITIFCTISICVAPVINNLLDKFTLWGKLNCEYYSDKAEYSSPLNDYFKNQKLESLCRRQNAMYNLEYSSILINLFLGVVCAQLSLIHFFDKGESFHKKTGLITLIGGLIAFVLTLVYVCFSGYIFTKDVAFEDVTQLDPYEDAILKLYPNGASLRSIDNNFVAIYDKDKTDDAQYVKYKDLGAQQYNYNKEYYESYYYTVNSAISDKCISSSTGSNCDYIYDPPISSNENKYIYDRWCLCLVLAVFVVILNLVMAIFGFLMFSGGKSSGETKIISIV